MPLDHDQRNLGLLQRRVADLERTARWQRWICAALVLGVVYAHTRAEITYAPDGTVVAENFIVRDRQGRVRASFGVWGAGAANPGGVPALRMWGKDERAAVALAISPSDTPSFLLRGGDSGDAGVWLSVLDGMPFLRLNDRSGHERAKLSVDDTGAPRVRFLNDADQVCVEIGSSEHGDPIFNLYEGCEGRDIPEPAARIWGARGPGRSGVDLPRSSLRPTAMRVR